MKKIKFTKENIALYNIVALSAILNFGNLSIAGLLAALFLAITPVFVAVSRNNTIDNILIVFLLLGCWALSIAAEKVKIKYLILRHELIRAII